MPDFDWLRNATTVLCFDGATGTMLQEAGLPAGMSPELFGLTRPDVMRGVHDAYIAAGADVITTNTFGGTGHKLGLGVDVTEVNRELARCGRQAADAAGGRVKVAGSVGPTGQFLKPMGTLTPAEMRQVFHEQILGLVQGGVDLLIAETQYDIAEIRAVAMAAREVFREVGRAVPVGLSMTFERGATLTGTPPAVFAAAAQNLGVDFVAINCGLGPDEMLSLAEAMVPALQIPLLVQPNAGLPQLKDGRTVFTLGPDEFAEKMRPYLQLGVRMVGGCCGTTPRHISALKAVIKDVVPAPCAGQGVLHLVSRSRLVRVAPFLPHVVIGERINPTGKKQLTAEYQAGELQLALQYATEQLEDGAQVLDVNVGAPMVDEQALLPLLTETLAARVEAPLCLDSTDPAALTLALDRCPAGALINSISGEPGRMEILGPLCRDHGAPCILLPLTSKKLPVTAAERIAIIESLVQQALDLGIPRANLMVDALALTVSSRQDAAVQCLATIRHCTEVLRLPTVLGLSNISFGLPARELLNATFLTLAMGVGLSASIANPHATRLKEARAAAEVLLGRDTNAESFIAGYTNWKPGGEGGGTSGSPAGGGVAKKSATTLKEAVLMGDKSRIQPLVEAALAAGMTPMAVVNEELIAAITQVGEKYERREYFLPQLIASAEAMQHGFRILKPLLDKAEAEGEKVHKPVVILATVEGDIHDIGKNIVALMLGNHGFEVHDLGKDVPAETIVRAAKERGASIIGLSALMTTTMVRMEDTVKLLREEALPAKVIVGGAVVSQEYADRIGAHGYAQDAVAAVRLAKELTAARA
ncbi:homocysteine S-methyltransferase family protein [Megalodesulfovibrio gigas]|uniref:Methionine synthase n=1 Tax=Megalodesulfovibrio gigas (strain ATCC 19364 / DSM 1382 / NCIMB 9332 / VKM B-1759) TaxID=1121448 RepID=T2GEZ2_MEGG1|nr:homocysteine S-methyltransferase family protein [Megalodesulfovibrio gigas]AGW15140.1 putative homocysteine S-methyltransferase [Megalodesulfovibrio gigas DSM 1382 = ATCC 19364]